jgi:hypothetical protein
MKKFIARLLFAASMFAAAAMPAHAGYTFVGQWDVNSGPWWSPITQPILTGQQAAALLFGGNASDYAISTNGADVGQINFSTWVSAYGQGHSGDIVAQDYYSDANQNGLYDGMGDTSAYIGDWCFGGNCINYAFRIDGNEVPEPAMLSLLALGLLGFSAARAKKKSA